MLRLTSLHNQVTTVSKRDTDRESGKDAQCLLCCVVAASENQPVGVHHHTEPSPTDRRYVAFGTDPDRSFGADRANLAVPVRTTQDLRNPAHTGPERFEPSSIAGRARSERCATPAAGIARFRP